MAQPQKKDPLAPMTSESSRDMGMWQNSVGASWGVSPANNDIIVDSQDKEAWPSIGNNSESASEADDNDNASVKSGSVISSSSNSGLPAGSATPVDAPGVGSMKANSNAAVWGTNFASDMGSGGHWGASPASSQMNSMGWSSSSQSSGLASSSMSGYQGGDTARTVPSSASASMGWPGLSVDSKNRMDSWNSSASDSSSWGQPANSTRQESSGWGALPPAAPNINVGTEGWGRPTEKPPPQAWGGANPVSQASSASGWGQPPGPPPSRWSDSGAGAADGAVPSWGNAAASKPPGPAGPSSVGTAGPGQFPSTWAQAACKGLPPQEEIKSLTPPCEPVVLNPKEQYIANVINSHDGWGKRPIRQDTSWEIEDSPRQQRRNSGSDDGSHWPATNNNGTAIWEGAKDAPDWQRQNSSGAAAAASSNEWTADNDHGTWRGPPGEPPANQWSRPPPSTGTEQWGQPGMPHAMPPQHSNNQWDNPPQNLQYQPPKADPSHWDNPKEDNMWDRNGTQQWNSSSSSSQSDWGDSNSSGDKMETGTWSSRGGRRPSSSSWGDPSRTDGGGWDTQSPPSQRRDSGSDVDDGTSFWGNPESHKPLHTWPGAPNGPMNSQIRGMPPEKMPPMWAAPPPSSRNWGEHSMASNKLEDPPMWMQQPSYMMGGRSQQPQMRSKTLQQLVELGFKREDAQNALITHNMNLESALSDLCHGKQMAGRRVLPPDQLGDHGDPSQFNSPMPGFSSGSATPMPLPTQLMGHQFRKNAALSFSLAAHIAAAANQGPSGNTVLRNQMGQVAQKQQQMFGQQLRNAAASGYIPQQLLNQPLTPSQQLQVQRLIELQKTYHNLLANQQLLQQQVISGKTNPTLQGQLEQITLTIPKIKDQLYQLQQQIAPQLLPMAAAKTTHPPVSAQAESKELKEIQSTMSALQLPKDQFGHSSSQHQPQQESRFSKWVCVPEREGSNELNRAPGTKPQTSTVSSSPNLPSKSEAVTSASSLLHPDSTWASPPGSSLSSQNNWPTSSATTTTASPSEALPSTDASASLASKESPSSSSSSSASMPSVAVSSDMIPEFVPGKPWQGLTKSVEDDPHVTPGSVSRPSLSVNTIRDDYVMTTLKKSTSPSVGSEGSGDSPAGMPTWSLGGLGRSSSSIPGPRISWSSTSSLSDQPATSLGSELWGSGAGQRNMRPPPGLPNANKTVTSTSGWQQSYSRSMSWAPGDNRALSMQGVANHGNWGSAGSTALVLKNLQQMDNTVIKTLCDQHGPLEQFLLNPSSGQAVVRYSSRDEAAKAQKSLNGCVLHNTAITADFLSEADAERMEQLYNLQTQLSTPQSAGYNSSTSIWSSSSNSYRPSKDISQWNGTSSFGGGTWGNGLWSTPTLEEHSSFLSNDLLGSQ